MMYNFKPMKRDDELSLGRRSEVRPFKRRASRILALLSGTFLLALACSPANVVPTAEVSGANKQPTLVPITQYDFEPDIATIQRRLEEVHRIRPDCFVTDVNTELEYLSDGKDTYIPRVLSDTVDPANRKAVDLTRQAFREALREEAARIKKLPSDIYRAVNLADTYSDLTAVNIEFANHLPEGDEQAKELYDLAWCGVVKNISLNGLAAIKQFEQNGSVVIPPFPTPTPIRPPA